MNLQELKNTISTDMVKVGNVAIDVIKSDKEVLDGLKNNNLEPYNKKITSLLPGILKSSYDIRHEIAALSFENFVELNVHTMEETQKLIQRIAAEAEDIIMSSQYPDEYENDPDSSSINHNYKIQVAYA